MTASFERLISSFEPCRYAEIGIFKGDRALRIASLLSDNSEIHLFDRESCVSDVAEKLAGFDQLSVYRHGNGTQIMNNYCWPLLTLIQERETAFDYVYLDGAHDLTIDGLAFYLVDILLVYGGILEFDDYHWCHKNSPTLNSSAPRNEMRGLYFNNRNVNEFYSDEQQSTSHVKLVVDNLVSKSGRYEDIDGQKRYFRKLAPT